MSEPVRIVIFKDEDLWVAQCLEHDICAQAADIGLESLPRAPERFFEMWDNRQAIG